MEYLMILVFVEWIIYLNQLSAKKWFDQSLCSSKEYLTILMFAEEMIWSSLMFVEESFNDFSVRRRNDLFESFVEEQMNWLN